MKQFLIRVLLRGVIEVEIALLKVESAIWALGKSLDKLNSFLYELEVKIIKEEIEQLNLKEKL